MTAWCASAVALVGVIGALAGCGGGGASPSASTSTGATTTESFEPTTPVVLRRPAEGRTVHSRAVGKAAARVPVHVAGTAEAGQTLLITASCAQRACRRFVLSNAQGDFAATLHLMLKGSPTRLTIGADYGGPHPRATAARTRVPLQILRVMPKRQAQPKSGSGAGPVESAPAQITPPPATATVPETAPPSSGSTDRRQLIVIGDSLAVGMRPYLAGDLSGWSVSIDGRVGRPLAEGMGILASTSIPNPGRTVLAISLFTNDDPTQTRQLRAAIAASLAKIGPQGCVIWATIARPAVGGVSYRAANAIIEQAASDDDRLRIVDWATYAAANAGILAADGVHPSPAGYRARATMYAQTAQSCA